MRSNILNLHPSVTFHVNQNVCLSGLYHWCPFILVSGRYPLMDKQHTNSNNTVFVFDNDLIAWGYHM